MSYNIASRGFVQFTVRSDEGNRTVFARSSLEAGAEHMLRFPSAIMETIEEVEKNECSITSPYTPSRAYTRSGPLSRVSRVRRRSYAGEPVCDMIIHGSGPMTEEASPTQLAA